MKKIYFFIVGFIVVCILGGVVGYFIARSTAPKPAIIRTSLPNNVANYSLNNLTADFKGKIIKKGVDFLTIRTAGGTEFNGYYNPQGISTFVDANTEQPISFDSLQVGNQLSGGISIVGSTSSAEVTTGQRKLGDVILHYVRVSN
jgi:hypothetical protein